MRFNPIKSRLVHSLVLAAFLMLAARSSAISYSVEYELRIRFPVVNEGSPWYDEYEAEGGFLFTSGSLTFSLPLVDEFPDDPTLGVYQSAGARLYLQSRAGTIVDITGPFSARLDVDNQDILFGVQGDGIFARFWYLGYDEDPDQLLNDSQDNLLNLHMFDIGGNSGNWYTYSELYAFDPLPLSSFLDPFRELAASEFGAIENAPIVTSVPDSGSTYILLTISAVALFVGHRIQGRTLRSSIRNA